ncbi:hypothetical protein HLBS07_01420 [Vibrio alginolyticus]|nr:hypothetical protein HLBS07_01420 [Vibrio alginolyticus]
MVPEIDCAQLSGAASKALVSANAKDIFFIMIIRISRGTFSDINNRGIRLVDNCGYKFSI